MAILGVKLIADASAYKRALRESEVATKRWATKVQSVTAGASLGARGGGGFGAALGVTAFTAAAVDAVKAASNMNEMVSKTNAVFGQSAQSVENWANTTTKAFGVSERQALTAASSFGALLTPIGIVGTQAAEQSRKLTELGADLASFYDTDVQSALDAIRSGLVGEAEPLRRYGVLLDETRVAQQAMADTGKKSATQLTNQEKALARVEIMMADTAQAQGDFARTQGDLAGQTKTFNAEMDDLKVQLGKGLVPAIGGVVTAFNNLFDAAVRVNDWFAQHHLGFLTRGAKDLGIGKSIEDQVKAANALPPGMAGPAQPEVAAAAAAATGAAKVAESTRKAAASMKDAGKSAAELAQQRNDWFDSMISRREFRLEGAPLESQFKQLQQVQALLVQRINVTRDITRRLNLEDELIRVQRQMQDVREQYAANQAEHERKMAELADKRKQAAEAHAKKLDGVAKALKAVVRKQKAGAASLQADVAASRMWGRGSNPFGTGGAISGVGGGPEAAQGTNALVRRGGGFVVVNQHFNAPTSDRHREARYALNATRAVFDG